MTRDAAGRCVAEHDRGGTLLAALVWEADRLAVASLRLAAGAWLTIEPRRGAPGPWGPSDRLGVSPTPLAAPDARATPGLTRMSALDWRAIDRIPVVAEPAHLPAGAASAVLNLVAALARDQARARLVYDGPYPGETLFVSLLESFRYDGTVADPLAAFRAGTLAWTPAPHERLLAADDVLVQWRGRVEKVLDGPRVYARADWQAITRHAPRRVRDAEDGVRCSLVLLGEVLEDHLVLHADGTLRARLPVDADESGERALSPALIAGLAAAVAASSAAPLGEEIERVARRLAPAWGPVERDLVVAGDDRVVVSHRVRHALARRLAGADRRARVQTALAGVVELAALVGDVLRGRAQAALAAAPPDVQLRAFEAPQARDGDAVLIIGAARALLEDLTA